MKIAIYGDSFGCINTDIPDAENHSWPQLLRKNHLVSNFSEIGSSFFIPLKSFQKNKHNHDVNIILVTKIGRMDLLDLRGICKPFINHRDEIQLTKDFVKSTARSIEEQSAIDQLFQFAEIYFDRRINFNYEEMSRTALMEQAMRDSSHTILISCFDDIIPGSLPLIDIFNFENVALGYQGLRFGEVVDNKFLKDLRQCHFSIENNAIIAEKIIHAIENKNQTIELKLSDFKTPAGPMSNYMRWQEI